MNNLIVFKNGKMTITTLQLVDVFPEEQGAALAADDNGCNGCYDR